MLLANGRPHIPAPVNEPVLGYEPGSPERAALRDAIGRLGSTVEEIPCVIGGERVFTKKTFPVKSPHRHEKVIALAHAAGPAEVEKAVVAARAAWKQWSRWTVEARAAVFLRAAELLAGRMRMVTNAATMLGQSKTAHQAEIDASCELIDFLRYNAAFAQRLAEDQPVSAPGMWNTSELRPLEGFVAAITPFNFSSIAVNLCAAPALMGNVVLWKPAHTAALAAWWGLRLLEEAGLPPGVINLLPGGPELGGAILDQRDLAGVHFTGSTATFQWLWQGVAERLPRYKSYPRLVGETGGKDFILAHASADPEALVTAIVRGGYEFQGQKCSAASRIYVPSSVWKKIEAPLREAVSGLVVGDPCEDFRTFVGAVIDEKAWTRLDGVQRAAKGDGELEVLAGGSADRSVGWFVRPTLVKTTNPKHRFMQEEFFGPIVTTYVYDDAAWGDVLGLVDETSPYALTGAVFATDRTAVHDAHDRLRHAAGNFYVNDKPTGAVVGQQPFGGGRQSGTNDKAGSAAHLMRWVSARTIKETFAPPRSIPYPFMKDA